MTKRKTTERGEVVLQEFPPVGQYRIRLLSNPSDPISPTLDIRQYICSETFEGFTEKGIKIAEIAQLDLVRDVLKDVIERIQNIPPPVCSHCQGTGKHVV